MIHPMQGCSIEIYITYERTWQDEAFQCLSATFSLKPRNGFPVGLSMLHRVLVFHKFQMTAQLTVNQYESMQLRCGDLPWHSPWSNLRSPHWPAWFVFSTEPIVGFQLPGCLQWRGSHGWSHIARRLLGLPANMMIDPFPSRMSQSWPNNLVQGWTLWKMMPLQKPHTQNHHWGWWEPPAYLDPDPTYSSHDSTMFHDETLQFLVRQTGAAGHPETEPGKNGGLRLACAPVDQGRMENGEFPSSPRHKKHMATSREQGFS